MIRTFEHECLRVGVTANTSLYTELWWIGYSAMWHLIGLAVKCRACGVDTVHETVNEEY